MSKSIAITVGAAFACGVLMDMSYKMHHTTIPYYEDPTQHTVDGHVISTMTPWARRTWVAILRGAQVTISVVGIAAGIFAVTEMPGALLRCTQQE